MAVCASWACDTLRGNCTPFSLDISSHKARFAACLTHLVLELPSHTQGAFKRSVWVALSIYVGRPAGYASVTCNCTAASETARDRLGLAAHGARNASSRPDSRLILASEARYTRRLLLHGLKLADIASDTGKHHIATRGSGPAWQGIAVPPSLASIAGDSADVNPLPADTFRLAAFTACEAARRAWSRLVLVNRTVNAVIYTNATIDGRELACAASFTLWLPDFVLVMAGLAHQTSDVRVGASEPDPADLTSDGSSIRKC